MTEILSPSNMDPLVLLRDDVKEPDENALASLKRLSTVALALGPNRTRTELLPFLLQYCEQSHIDGLTIVASQLGECAEAVGGLEHVQELFPVLEKLAAEEEDRVRTVAVQSIVKLCPLLMTPDISLMPLISRLANAEWYSTRVSACSLLVTAYPLVSSDSQEECRTLYLNFAADETELIKVAASLNLGALGLAMQQELFVPEIMPMLRSFAQDGKEAVRLNAMDACALFAGKLPSDILQEHVLPIMVALQSDKIWRVRKRFCKHCPILCKSMKEAATATILPLFVSLLKDKEGAVREQAVSELHNVCQECKGASDIIAPSLEPLASDLVATVRIAFAQSLVPLATTLGVIPVEQLSRMLLKLGKDESPEVRYEVAVGLDSFIPLLGAEAWSPVMLPLTSDSKWRVRLAVTRKLAVLAKNTFVRAQMPTFIGAALVDPVYAVREMCCLQIGQMFVQFGEAWGVENLMTPVLTIAKKENYLLRLTAMTVVANTAPTCGPVVVARTLFPLVEAASSDSVANVRLASTHAIRALLLVADSDTRFNLFSLLAGLQEDKDCDVAFFAMEARRFIAVKEATTKFSTLTISMPSSSSSSSSSSFSPPFPTSLLPNFALFTDEDKPSSGARSPPFPSLSSPDLPDPLDLPPFPSAESFG